MSNKNIAAIRSGATIIIDCRASLREEVTLEDLGINKPEEMTDEQLADAIAEAAWEMGQEALDCGWVVSK